MLVAASDRPARQLSSCRQLAGTHLATKHLQWLLLVPGTNCHLMSDLRHSWPRFVTNAKRCSSRCPMDNQTTVLLPLSTVWPHAATLSLYSAPLTVHCDGVNTTAFLHSFTHSMHCVLRRCNVSASWTKLCRCKLSTKHHTPDSSRSMSSTYVSILACFGW